MYKILYKKVVDRWEYSLKYKHEEPFKGFYRSAPIVYIKKMSQPSIIDQCILLCIKEVTLLDKIKGFLCKRN